jgi:hypothetical protein
MSHASYTQGNQIDSRLLVVRSQIAILTPGPSFGHNLCFKCLNGSCKPTLDIYVSRAFQWYKELPNSMGFDPSNFSLKIWESIGTPTLKMGVHLGVGVFILSHFPTLSTSQEHEMWLSGFTWEWECSFSHTFLHSQPFRSMKCDFRASLLVHILTSLCFGREPKVRVVT